MKEKFSPIPTFEINKELQGRLFRSIIVSLMIMTALFIALSALAFQEILPRTLRIGGGVLVVSLILLWLIKRRQLSTAGILLVSFLWLVVSFMSYTAGGVGAPIFIGYVVVILFCGLIFNTVSGLLIAILSVAFGGFMVYAHSNQLLPPAIEYSEGARLSIYAFFFFVALFVQKAAVDTTKIAIAKASISENQYRLFLENIPTITYINDLTLEARTLYVSPQVEKLLGYRSSEFLNDPTFWMNILFTEDVNQIALKNQRTVESGEPFEADYRLVARNGNIIWVRDEAKLVRDDEGRPLYWLGVWTDITQAKSSENALANIIQTQSMRTNQLQTASEVSRAATSILELNELMPTVVELIRSHFDYYYVGIFILDEEHKLAVLKAATGEMGKQMLEKRHSLVIGNSSMIGWCIANNQARIALDVGKEAVRFNNPALPLTRSEVALPLRFHGHVIGAMTIQSTLAAAFTEADITALQTMADQVANAIETARLFDERAVLIGELESKNAELERYTYTVSHDLKSPLVTIRGYLGYLKDAAAKGDLEHFDVDMNRIIKATETMQTLLNDLLELSRVGRVINPSVSVPFGEIVKDAMNLLVEPQKGQLAWFKVQEVLPSINCDRTRVTEVLQNLISNSIKFMGDQPEPSIRVGVSGVDEKSGFLIFYVADNGIGIERKYHDTVFGMFNRLDQKIEGTGIGLTLVKRIIEIHGGRIWVESEGQGKGSTFYFTLPSAEVIKP